MTTPTHAERLLLELGIERPDEIDLEAIAFTLGARVRYRRLDECDARIVGTHDKAIITINYASSHTRQRFSLGHEIGHWRYHRGKILICSEEDIGGHGRNKLSPERMADAFAADLLMPWYLFRPAARELRRATFQTVRMLAAEFDVSPEAAAIRLIDSRLHTSILVCHGRSGRKWFHRSPDVPERWFPQDQLDQESYAFDILLGNKKDDTMPHKIDADAWFDRTEAGQYKIAEETIRVEDGKILTLLNLSESLMLEED